MTANARHLAIVCAIVAALVGAFLIVARSPDARDGDAPAAYGH
jgi:hypothetical protein